MSDLGQMQYDLEHGYSPSNLKQRRRLANVTDAIFEAQADVQTVLGLLRYEYDHEETSQARKDELFHDVQCLERALKQLHGLLEGTPHEMMKSNA